MTLEWLLVLGAVAGIAAGSYLAVERVVDGETLRPAGPAARLVAADVVAAVVMHDALDRAIERGGAGDAAAFTEFAARCESIDEDFDDVVADAVWTLDPAWTPHWLDGEDAHGDERPLGSLRSPARCTVTPRDLSAGT